MNYEQEKNMETTLDFIIAVLKISKDDWRKTLSYYHSDKVYSKHLTEA